MTWTPINVGSAINAGDGEAIRNAFTKVNTAMAEIYNLLRTNGFDTTFIANGGLPFTKFPQIASGQVIGNASGITDYPGVVSLATIGAAIPQPVTEAVSATRSIVAADVGKVLNCSGTFTATMALAATLGNGFSFWIRNTGSGIVTLQGTSAEQIDGATSLLLYPKMACRVVCTGTAFLTLGLTPETLLYSGNAASLQYQEIDVPVGYRSFRLLLSHFSPITAGAVPLMQGSTDGGTTWKSSNGDYVHSAEYNFPGSTVNQYGSDDGYSYAFALASNTQGANTSIGQIEALLSFNTLGSVIGSYQFRSTIFGSAGTSSQYGGGSAFTGRWNRLRVFFNTGNIYNCDYALFGIR